MERDSVKGRRWDWLFCDSERQNSFLGEFVQACERRGVRPEAVQRLVDPVEGLADPCRYRDVWDALADLVSSDLVARVPTRNVITLPGDLTAAGLMALIQERMEGEGFEVDSMLAEMWNACGANGVVSPWFDPGTCLEWDLWTPTHAFNGRDWRVEDVRQHFAGRGFRGDARAFLYWCAVYADRLMGSVPFYELTTVPDAGGWWHDADGDPCGAFLLQEAGAQLVSVAVGEGWRGFGPNASFVAFRPAECKV